MPEEHTLKASVNLPKDGNEELIKRLKLFEEERFNSFRSWPFEDVEKCSISAMAKAGFYYTGTCEDDDSATCFVCGKVLDGWENTDDPWIEHEKHSANCKFVQMRRCEDDLTIDEFLNLAKHVTKQYLTDQFRKKEAAFMKKGEKIRDTIKNHQL